MHISIIDDEKNLTSKISKKLKLNGYTVSEFYSYNEFMRDGYFDNISDLYIVDLSLGDGSGFEIIKHLRTHKRTNTPIIVISGYGDLDNKIYGLDLGADDYLTKPFYPEELLSRVKAVLRRPHHMIKFKDLEYKNLVVKYPNYEILLNGVEISLSKKEKNIIRFFITNKGKLIDKEDFIKTIWGYQTDIDVSDNTINATLSKLRKKLGDNFPIETRRNLGYILE